MYIWQQQNGHMDKVTTCKQHVQYLVIMGSTGESKLSCYDINAAWSVHCTPSVAPGHEEGIKSVQQPSVILHTHGADSTQYKDWACPKKKKILNDFTYICHKI